MSLAPSHEATIGKGGSIMPLTDVAIRNAKPREKPYKMGDALGLFLLVQSTGGQALAAHIPHPRTRKEGRAR